MSEKEATYWRIRSDAGLGILDHCKLPPVVNTAWVAMRSVGPVCPHLYAAGSGESDGLAKRFVIIGLSGRFRLMPLGGIGLWNHLA